MSKLIFTGDSVTDCSRKRALRYDLTSDGLGHGWVANVADVLQVHNAQVKIWNRGFAGSLCGELCHQQDWWPLDDDVASEMDIATLMIGINDIWHPFWKNSAHQLPQALEAFENLVWRLQQHAKTVIVCEPVALPCGDVSADWWPLLDQLSAEQQRITEQFGAIWLPLQQSLQLAARGKFSDYLSDGVHPTELGHRWLGQQWLACASKHSLL